MMIVIMIVNIINLVLRFFQLAGPVCYDWRSAATGVCLTSTAQPRSWALRWCWWWAVEWVQRCTDWPSTYDAAGIHSVMAENLLKGGVLSPPPLAPFKKMISKRLIRKIETDSCPIVFNSKNLNWTIHFFRSIKEEADYDRFACILVNLAVWIKGVS